MDAEQIGNIGVLLGAGRRQKGEAIDHAAGIRLWKKTGDCVCAGDCLATLHTNRADVVGAAQAAYRAAITIQDAPPQAQPLLYTIVR